MKVFTIPFILLQKIISFNDPRSPGKGMVASYYGWWGAFFWIWTTQLAVVVLGIGVLADNDLMDEGDDQSMPDYIQLTATYGGKTQDMTLEKHSDLNVNFPMFELVTDDKGESITKTVKITKTKDYAPYIEVNHRATFLVYREKDSDGTAYLSAEGLMADNGEMFKLRSKERDGKSFDFTDRNSSFTSMREGLIDRVTESPSFTRDVQKLRSKRALKRLNRQVNRDVNCDIIAIADFALYKRFLDSSNEGDPTNRQNDAFRMIREHFVSVFSEVTMIYAGITSLPFRINVLLRSIYVATYTIASKWMEATRSPGSFDTNPDTINAHRALDDFNEWLSSTTSLPEHDFVILFTGYDVSENRFGIRYLDAEGVAFVGTICSGRRASAIVEDLDIFTFWIAAHELGHGVGASHDGINNSCDFDGDYIMANSRSSSFLRNFSTCSLTAFNDTINKLSLQNGPCLFNALPSNLSVVTLPPPTAKSAEEHCQKQLGPTSKLCRKFMSEPSDICSMIWCTTANGKTCSTVRVEMGTSCGNKRWCFDNKCVESEFAPEVDEKCIFGDAPSSNCGSRVSQWNGVCYDDTFYSECCGTCAKWNQSVPDCEYGDRVRTCSKLQCSPNDIPYLKSCCRTCSNYVPPESSSTTTSPTTTTTSPGITSTSPQRNSPVHGDVEYWLLKFCLIVIPVLTLM